MEQNKNIENFFKKKFSDPVQEQDWNTPPEDSWDNILIGLEEPKRKRRVVPYIPWLIGGLGLFLGIYLFNSNQSQNNRIDHLENKINDIGESFNKDTKTIDEQELKELSKVTTGAEANAETIRDGGSRAEGETAEGEVAESVAINGIIESTQTPAKGIQIENSTKATQKTDDKNNNKSIIENTVEKFDSKKTSSLNTKNINSGQQNNIPAGNQRNSVSNNNNNNSNGSQQILPGSSNSLNTIVSDSNKNEDNQNSNVDALNDESNIIVGSDSEPIEKLDLINMLEVRQILFPIQERLLAGLGSNEAKQLDMKKKNMVYLGLYSRYNQWYDVNSGEIDNVLEELRTEDNTLPSFGFGLNSSIELGKKWTINIGALYNQRSHHSVYLLNLPYSTTSETIDDDGEYFNAFQHSLPTSLGDVDTDVTLSRSQSSSITNNEIVGIDLSFNTVTKSIIIPVSAAFFPAGANNGLYFSGGLVNEIVFKSELTSIQSFSNHDTVNDKAININYDATQQKKYDFGASLGLGYVFNLKQDFNLMLGANYDFGLSNHYANNGYEHRLNNLSVGVSLMKAIVR